MIDHLAVKVRDFDVMAPYYARVLATLGYATGVSYPGGLQLIDPDGGADTWVLQAAEGTEPAPIHVAWRARNVDEIKAFYEAALDGGMDNGAPGPRDYHPGYYACFVHDPEGNNIEAVLHDYEA